MAVSFSVCLPLYIFPPSVYYHFSQNGCLVVCFFRFLLLYCDLINLIVLFFVSFFFFFCTAVLAIAYFFPYVRCASMFHFFFPSITPSLVNGL